MPKPTRKGSVFEDTTVAIAIDNPVARRECEPKFASQVIRLLSADSQVFPLVWNSSAHASMDLDRIHAFGDTRPTCTLKSIRLLY